MPWFRWLFSASHKAAIEQLSRLCSHLEARLGRIPLPRSLRLLGNSSLYNCAAEGPGFGKILAGDHSLVLEAAYSSLP